MIQILHLYMPRIGVMVEKMNRNPGPRCTACSVRAGSICSLRSVLNAPLWLLFIGVYIRFSYTFQYHILLYITACDVLLGMDTLSGHSLVFRRLHRFALEIICKMVNKFIFIVRHVLEAWCITWPISDRSLHYVHWSPERQSTKQKLSRATKQQLQCLLPNNNTEKIILIIIIMANRNHDYTGSIAWLSMLCMSVYISILYWNGACVSVWKWWQFSRSHSPKRNIHFNCEAKQIDFKLNEYKYGWVYSSCMYIYIWWRLLYRYIWEYITIN